MALLEKSTKHIKNVHQSFSSYFKRLRSRERSQSHFVKPPSPCDQNQTKTTKKNIGSQCLWIYGRPDNSAGEKSTCNAGDPSLISGLGGSPGEGIGYPHSSILGLPWWLSWWRIHLQCGRPGFVPWVGKIPWRRAWHPTPVFLPGESPWTEEPGRL